MQIQTISKYCFFSFGRVFFLGVSGVGGKKKKKKRGEEQRKLVERKNKKRGRRRPPLRRKGKALARSASALTSPRTLLLQISYLLKEPCFDCRAHCGLRGLCGGRERWIGGTGGVRMFSIFLEGQFSNDPLALLPAPLSLSLSFSLSFLLFSSRPFAL